MNARSGILILTAALPATYFGCSSGDPAGKAASEAPATAESLYREGHRLYGEGEVDSAVAVLEDAREIDSLFVPAIAELGHIYYHRALTHPEGDPDRMSAFRKSLGCYAQLETLGHADADAYERLMEMTRELGEQDRFLMYAERLARHYPGDRESYSLGLAYLEAGRFQDAIRVEKDAIDRFGQSPYLSGFYRLLGDAYMAVDRQQSAERTYEEGVAIAERQLSAETVADSSAPAAPTHALLLDSRKAMLVGLRKIYRLHNKKEKLEDVERRLAELP